MAIMEPGLVEGVQLLARQAASTTASLASSVLATATSSSIVPTSTDPTSMSTTAGALPTATSTESGNNNSSGNNSSPLLFFVALGFGVVFTNLWIIVGVKYCFRYNARSRQLRLNEDGEPINMDNIQRPHRRRREKKLMTMDEVNEKFPMMKYKTWVASRAQEGLPSCGGVSAPASRANSLNEAEGVITELSSKERDMLDDKPATSETSKVQSDSTKPGHAPKESTSSTLPVQSADPETKANAVVSDDVGLAKGDSHQSDDEEDEHINAALPPELVGTSGDTCAICIDSLEDDDDVRGLTCGHAFHAACLDPWLTSRRACCPLCKADYYTPKPRAPAAETTADGSPLPLTVAIARIDANRGHGINMPSSPPTSRLNNLRATTRRILPIHNAEQQGSVQSPGSGTSRGFMSRFRQRADMDSQAAQRSPEISSQQQTGGLISNIRSGLSGLVPSRRGPAATGTTVTDLQLEAGVRSA